MIKLISRSIRIFLFATLIMAILPHTSYSAGLKWEVSGNLKDVLKNKTVTLTVPRNDLIGGFLEINSIPFYYVKSYDRVFFPNKTIEVTVKDISCEKNGVIFEVSHKFLGTGQVRLYFDENITENLTATDISSAFNLVLSDPDRMDVYVNKESQLIHIKNCNHREENYLKMPLEMALKTGNKECGLCFRRFLQLPDSGLESNIARQAVAEYNHYRPVAHDLLLHQRVERVGMAVLKNWPIPLLGYEYSFKVVDSAEVNAVGIPRGQVFITKGLLDSIENDEELEAVLAHEIAHIELRHGLRSTQKRIQQQNQSVFLSTLAFGIAGGIAAANNNGALATSAIATGAALVTLAAIDIIYNNYDTVFEEEADLFAVAYFKYRNKDMMNLTRVFKKLMFFNLTSIGNPNPESLTHPYLSERIARIENLKLKFFDNAKYFYESEGDGKSLNMKLYFSFIDNEKLKIFANIDNFNGYNGLNNRLIGFVDQQICDYNFYFHENEKKYPLSLKTDFIKNLFGFNFYLEIKKHDGILSSNPDKLTFDITSASNNYNNNQSCDQLHMNFLPGQLNY